MDEVDGMGAGDRGGLAQLVLLIKQTRVPIICICNDINNPKMRTLRNHCWELHFRRPTVQMILGRMRSIAYQARAAACALASARRDPMRARCRPVQEKLDIDAPSLQRIISSCNADMRQARAGTRGPPPPRLADAAHDRVWRAGADPQPPLGVEDRVEEDHLR